MPDFHGGRERLVLTYCSMIVSFAKKGGAHLLLQKPRGSHELRHHCGSCRGYYRGVVRGESQRPRSSMAPIPTLTGVKAAGIYCRRYIVRIAQGVELTSKLTKTIVPVYPTHAHRHASPLSALLVHRWRCPVPWPALLLERSVKSAQRFHVTAVFFLPNRQQ